MSQPKSLLEIAGAKPNSIDWSNAALILIDYQKEYTEGELSLGDKTASSIEIASKLLEHARANSVPIFHVVHHGPPGGPAFNPDSDMVSLIPEAEAMNDEAIIVKKLPNAFKNTNLSELIDLTGRKQLVFCGFMSHMCVNSSVRASLDLGYSNFVCSDACATRDLVDDNGDFISAETLHKASMAALRDRFATVGRFNTLVSA